MFSPAQSSKVRSLFVNSALTTLVIASPSFALASPAASSVRSSVASFTKSTSNLAQKQALSSNYKPEAQTLETYPETTLPLRLVSLHRGNSNIAIVESVANNEKLQDVFEQGNSVFGLARLHSMSDRGIILEKEGNLEFLAFRKTGTGTGGGVVAPAPRQQTIVPKELPSLVPATNFQATLSAQNSNTNTEESGPQKLSILSQVIDGPTPLRIVDRRELFKNVRNYADVLQSHKPEFITTENGKLAVKIGSIPADSPAKELGMQDGDVIKSVNGQSFSSFVDAYQAIRTMSNDDILTLEVERNGTTESLSFASQYQERLSEEKLEEIKNKHMSHVQQLNELKKS